jgi:uncharacterized protein (DUF305 family)
MRRSPLLLLISALAPTLLVAACGGGTPPPRSQPQPERDPPTQADVKFMRDMIGHHGQALVMAEWAPSHGASPAIRTLAERIVSGQEDEIALMQQWLRDRNQPVAEPAGEDHQGHSGHDMLMPGMLTQAQLDELDQARGREFDRLFLRYMIQHHQGALTMVNRLFATPGAAREASAFKLANDISADQSSEIARMERMLGELPAAGGGR